MRRYLIYTNVWVVIGLHAELGRGMAMNDDFEFFNERLFYNENTGELHWRNTDLVGNRARGKKAGTNNGEGYIVLKVTKNGKASQLKAHRVIWLLVNRTWPIECIDHINGDGTDNRIENLRESTYGQNNQNRRTSNKKNEIGVLGVSVQKSGNYRARISVNGFVKYLGMFKTIEDARIAYIQAKRELHSFCTI